VEITYGQENEMEQNEMEQNEMEQNKMEQNKMLMLLILRGLKVILPADKPAA
jgi:hypothetical protein